MVNILLLTQGQLAVELVRAAEHIAGPTTHLKALSLEWDDDVETNRAKIGAAVAEAKNDEGLLLLTDIFGGTPYNLATEHFEPGEVEIVAGVNLPVVVRLACMETASLPVSELAEWIVGKGRDSICLGGLPEKPKPLCRPAEVVARGREGNGRG